MATDVLEAPPQAPNGAPPPSWWTGSRLIPLDDIEPNPFQPRRVFDDAELRDLAESIAAGGLEQPLLVRLHQTGGALIRDEDVFQLIAGERRKRAIEMLAAQGRWLLFAGDSPAVPCTVRVATDQEALELALDENLRRHDLNPMEEAGGFAQLEGMGVAQVEIARRFGLSAPAVSNRIRLTHLPQSVQEDIAAARLSPAHGVELCALSGHAATCEVFANKAIEGQWTQKALAAEIAAFRAESAPPQLPLGDEGIVEGVEGPGPSAPDETALGEQEIAVCRQCHRPETEVLAGGDHMTKSDLCSRCDAEFQAAMQAPAPPKPAAPVPATPAPAKKPGEFAVGDGVQWADGSSHGRTGKIAEVGGALYWVQPTGSSGPAKRKSFHKKNCILKAWDGKSAPTVGHPDPSSERKPAGSSAIEQMKAAASDSAPTPPAAPSVPAGFTRTLVPSDDYFFCEDHGVTMADAFALLKRFALLADRLDLSIPALMDHLNDVVNEKANLGATPDEIRTGIFFFHPNRAPYGAPEAAEPAAESPAEPEQPSIEQPSIEPAAEFHEGDLVEAEWARGRKATGKISKLTDDGRATVTGKSKPGADGLTVQTSCTVTLDKLRHVAPTKPTAAEATAAAA